jgi:hypothetical protein
METALHRWSWKGRRDGAPHDNVLEFERCG